MFENTKQLRRSIEAEKIAFRIEQQARDDTPLRRLIADWADDLMALIGAHGLLLYRGGGMESFGTVPEQGFDFSGLRGLLSDGVATTSQLSDVIDMDEVQMQQAAGAALLGLSEDGEECLVFLRRHFDQTIRWAGKPDKIETRTEDGITRLSLRPPPRPTRANPRGSTRRAAARPTT